MHCPHCYPLICTCRELTNTYDNIWPFPGTAPVGPSTQPLPLSCDSDDDYDYTLFRTDEDLGTPFRTDDDFDPDACDDPEARQHIAELMGIPR